MSASRIPTFRPMPLSPSATLTAVVDLPTPPLPDATAMIALTPSGPCAALACRPGAGPGARGAAASPGARAAAPPARSAVSATSAEVTPAMPRTASSAAFRTASQRCTTAASTLIEKKTLPSLTMTSESLPVVVSGVPSGDGTRASRSRTISLLGAIKVSPHRRCRADLTASIGPAKRRSTRLPRASVPGLSRLWPHHASDGCPDGVARRARRKEETMAKVSFLGLGVMGYPMAGHLRKKGGHEVTVYNRTSAKAEAWAKEYGGRHAPTPKAAAAGQDFVMMRVGNHHDVREVKLGAEGAFPGMKRGAVFVDHTTASAEIARELYEQANKGGFSFVDAPVAGGQAGAVNGVLTVMCGGDKEPFARA